MENLSAEGLSNLAENIVIIFPDFEQFLQSLIGEAAGGNLRLFANNPNPDYLLGETPAMLFVSILEQSSPLKIPLFIVLEITSQSLELANPDLDPLGKEILETSTGVQIGIITYGLYSPEIEETVIIKSIIFYSRDVLAIITLIIPETSWDQAEVDLNVIVDKLEVIEP